MATIDDSLEVAGDPLAAEQAKQRLFVAVRVNGEGPFRFLVDSGADRTVIGAGLSARLALPPGPVVRLQGVAGSRRVATAVIDRLTIGQSTVDQIAAPALPEGFLGAQGLIGIDALADQRLMLDFEARTITVQDSRRPEPPHTEDEIIVTARRRSGQLILTQANADGVHIFAVIDTGTEITTGNSALFARIFAGRSPPPVQWVTLTSVTGQTIAAQLAVLPHLRIGGVLLGNVPVAFVDAPPFALFGLAHAPALLLGNDVLKSFRKVSLDFRARKVRFRLPKNGIR